MLDHLVGRPSPSWKRTQVFLVILFWLWRIVSGNKRGLPFLYLRPLNRKLSRFSPWQLIASTLTGVYIIRNFDKLLKLQSPEPLARLYSSSYYRATWINTGLDAGFSTALSIRTKWLRDLASILFSVYYILYPNEADEKVRKNIALVNKILTRSYSFDVTALSQLQSFFESVGRKRATHTHIRALTHLPSVTIRRKILFSRPSSSTYERPITAYLFFALPEKQLGKATDLILDFPGGGFVAMSPEHHEERLRMWAISTGKPVLAIDYGKAPEYPYPFAIDEAFETYKLLVESTGTLIGMSGKKLNILISGDSAGANIAVNVVLKIIEHNESSDNRVSPPLPQPIALVFNYPALDFNFTSWMTPDHLRVLRTEESSGSLPGIKELAAQKDHLNHIVSSPLSMVGDKRPTRRRKPLKRQTSWKDTIRGLTAAGEKAEESSKEPKKRRSSSALRTPSSRRSTFLEPRQNDSPTDVDTDSDSEDQDYDQYREEERPIQARVRYVYKDSSHPKTVLPRSNSALVKQQEELSMAVQQADSKATQQFGQKEPIGTRLTMTSRTGYFQDRIITPSMMRAMAILYIGPYRNPDFATDYHLSPILAPSKLLAQFPPILMQCGEKDPLVDDTLIFAGRVREAKRARKAELDLAVSGKSARFGESLRMSANEAPVDLGALKRERDRLARQTEEDWVQLVIWSEWSHGYLQMVALMSEATQVIEELAEWIDGAFERYSSKTVLPISRRRGESPAKKAERAVTSETETDDSGITFVPRRRSPPSSLNGRRSPSPIENGHGRGTSETDTAAGQRTRAGGLAITENELIQRRRLLDAHIFE
ncbi:hypothetical protein MIND_00065600 [Mycena indigotica]|uniref:Alpha/beta hydrolase fold-3 domain-containing protein n=1 Tax=Mycena indigotica TaxID=2126181 RepID=A0A8H6TD51_9AGAR|nr:uncharacterized protein MIND_00065600 [Mycena indigotica]KAF7315503.1 hypothetical protein MIND_00065600 [Mycena indigotica]